MIYFVPKVFLPKPSFVVPILVTGNREKEDKNLEIAFRLLKVMPCSVGSSRVARGG